jgi:hypothetical protein
MSMILDGSNGVQFNDSSLQGAAASPYVLKNRIINGAMVIDQRNAGASLTPTTDGQYSLDRWRCSMSVASKFSVQQQTSVIPTGFSYATKITSLSAYTVGSGDYFSFDQMIEGYNVADLGFGTSNAKTITISFLVYSSLTGTFGASLMNSASNRSYPFTYTISNANTWEQKSVTIAGDTSGTWLTTNGTGLFLRFGLGVGSTYSGTAGSWAGTTYVSATGATSVVGTNGATWYITGVQLEIGTSATPFERRLYNQELANCQRYFYWNGGTNDTSFFNVNSGNAAGAGKYPITMRATPTIVIYNTTTSSQVALIGGGTGTSVSASIIGLNSFGNVFGTTVGTGLGGCQFNFSASAEL